MDCEIGLVVCTVNDKEKNLVLLGNGFIIKRTGTRTPDDVSGRFRNPNIPYGAGLVYCLSHDNRGKHGSRSSQQEDNLSFAPDSPVLALFRCAAVKLNDRHDRHERIVKLSRDITIESKRIIFLLHSAMKPEDKLKAVTEAKQRLEKLTAGPIKSVALELENSPAFIHARAISPGLQEFIEARTFHHLMEHDTLPLWESVQKELTFEVKSEDTDEVRVVQTLLPQTDFLLGIADLTGELMRRSINSLTTKDVEECFNSCQVVRDLYSGFLGITSTGRELYRKLYTTRANVLKVEAAAYAVRVRGGEALPSFLLPAPTASAPHDHDRQGSDDEGYF